MSECRRGLSGPAAVARRRLPLALYIRSVVGLDCDPRTEIIVKNIEFRRRTLIWPELPKNSINTNWHFGDCMFLLWRCFADDELHVLCFDLLVVLSPVR